MIAFQKLGQYAGLNLFTPTAGCGHIDELFMLFKQNQLPFETAFTESDRMTSQNLLKLWTDFARTGNPTPDSQTSGLKWER